MIESVDGFISAAPIPCAARAPISQWASGASPHTSEDAVKTTRPTTNRSRRP